MRGKRYIGFWVLVLSLFLTACGKNGVETWTVTCPWAETGVAGRVNVRTAEEMAVVSKQFLVDAQAVKGDAKTVNQWIKEEDAQSNGLVFVGEGLFAIAPIMNPDSLEFSYEDFIFVENLYSSVFVMSARADLDLHSIWDVQMYMSNGQKIKVAVNGTANAESFLTYAFFGSMSHAKEVELVVCESADQAANAVSSGEADFAISHQSQILKAYEEGKVTVVCAFDADDIAEGPFAGVEGVGKYGYPYFKNRCFIMAPKGVSAGKIAQLKKEYNKIFRQEEIQNYYSELMIQIDPITEAEVKEHLENVREIVQGYRMFFE